MGILRRNNESEFHFETAGIRKSGQVAPAEQVGANVLCANLTENLEDQPRVRE
jgi:hypothetical protein